MCKNWREKGQCKYGDKCLFAHGSSELTKRSSANGPEPVKAPEPVADNKAKEMVPQPNKPQASGESTPSSKVTADETKNLT